MVALVVGLLVVVSVARVVVVVVVVVLVPRRSLAPLFTASPTQRGSWRCRKVVLFKGRKFLRVCILSVPSGAFPLSYFRRRRLRGDGERGGEEERAFLGDSYTCVKL